MKKTITIFLLLPLLHTMAQLNTPNNWQWQYPKPFEGAYRVVEKVSDGIIAAGDRSILQKTTDGGDTWIQLPVADEVSILYMEFFAGGTTGFYFTEKGKPYKSINSGNTWQIDNSFPVNDRIIHASMYYDTLAVYFGNGANTYCAKLTAGGSWQTTQTTGVVKAGYYPYYNSYNSNAFGDTIYVFDTIRGYHNTSQVGHIVNMKPSYDYQTIYLGPLSSGPGWITKRFSHVLNPGQTQTSFGINSLGNYDNLFYYDSLTWYASEVPSVSIPGLSLGTFAKSTNGGQVWNDLGAIGAYDIEFDNAFENYVACGGGQIIKTINAGALYTNTQVESSITFTINLNKYFVSISNVYQLGNTVYAFGLGTAIINPGSLDYQFMFMKSVDFGRTWTLLKMYTPQNLVHSPERYVTRKFYAFNDNEFMALMAKRTDSYGSNVSDLSILDICIYDSNTGTSTVTSNQLFAEQLCDFYPFSASTGMMLGYNTPSQQNTLVKYDCSIGGFLSFTPISNNVGTGLTMVNFANQQIGFAAGEAGKIVRTLDGGITWEDASVAGVQINNIQCISQDTVFVVANSGGFFRSYNASAININWVPKGTQTFDSIYYLKFYDGQNGFLVTNNDLLLTSNGGNTFQKLKIPFHYFGSYDTVKIAQGFELDAALKIGKATGNVVATDKSLTSFLYANGPVVLSYGSGIISSISNIEQDIQVQVFPVPASNQLYVLTGRSESVLVKLYDLQGQLINSLYSTDGVPLDISNLVSGFYLGHINTSKGNVVVRFVKE